jgi:hypothetical protein
MGWIVTAEGLIPATELYPDLPYPIVGSGAVRGAASGRLGPPTKWCTGEIDLLAGDDLRVFQIGAWPLPSPLGETVEAQDGKQDGKMNWIDRLSDCPRVMRDGAYVRSRDAALMPRDRFRTSTKVSAYDNLLISLVPTRGFEPRTY